jgi:hypothetical protein
VSSLPIRITFAFLLFQSSAALALDGQADPAAVEDGSGGMIIVWEETRGAAVDICLKLLDGDGNSRGPTVVVCAATGDQLNPAIAPDGRGGAIVTWQDARGGGADIYAQRVLATGVVDPAWPADGRALCTATGNQLNPAIVADGAGGGIVTWEDNRGAASDIYAQRVLAGGIVDPAWPANGRAACAAIGAQVGPRIASDGAGGAIITWFDNRIGNLDIFVQRVLRSGVVDAAWPAGGRALCAAGGDQREPKIIADGLGGAIVTWYDLRGPDHDIYAQRVRAGGAVDPAWPTDGLALCTAAGSQSGPELISDGAGGAIVAWYDFRSGTSDVYAQRVLAGGVADPAWPDDGRALVTATGNQLYPQLVMDGEGGAFVAWQDQRGGNRDVYAQRLLADGAIDPSWPADGRVLCGAAGEQVFNPAPVITDGRGGAIVTWEDDRDPNPMLYAARVSATGTDSPAWNADGVALCTAGGVQDAPAIAADGVGGAIVAWEDDRSDPNGDIYARRVLASGAADPQWPADGAALCTATSYQAFPAMIPDGTGGAIVTWEDYRNPSSDIFAQRVLASGAADPAWPANGRALCTATGGQVNPTIATDGTGGAIVTWSDSRSGPADIYAQRALAGGVVDPAWPANGRALCAATGFQRYPQVTPDGAGGAIVTWQDERSDPSGDIYAQRVLAGGAVDPAWPANGRAICTATSYQVTPRIAPDGAGGAIVTWEDYRDLFSDVYAQHVLAGGSVDPAWPADGRALCAASGGQYVPAIIPDGAGGAIVAWADNRGASYDIYAQRVLASGAVDPAWPADGRALCTADGDQLWPTIAVDGAGGAIVTWEDDRASPTRDVYAQRVLAGGVVDPAWPADGLALCTASGPQLRPTIAADGAGGAIVTWADSRGSSSDIYAQRITRSGPDAVLWTPDGVTPILLSLQSAEARPGAVRLTWRASRTGLAATLYRQEEDHGWVALATLAADGDGGLRYVDEAVSAGRRYGYRLGVRSGADEAYLGEVWLTVPRRDALALEGPRPNPASRDLVVSFALEAGDATLELLDVAGRRVITRQLTGMAGGSHVLGLDAAPLPAGVYTIRLTQGGRTVSRKAVIAR